VQRTPGYGRKEVVYKAAIEIEFINADIPFLREAELVVCYKGKILSHKFFADFLLF